MSPDRKRLLVMIVLAIVATAGVVLLIGRAANYAHLLRSLRDARIGWLAVCAAGESLAVVGYIACYQAVAEVSGGPRLSGPVVLRVAGLALSAFSVASAIGGLSVDFWALREAGESAGRASARVLAFETLQWAVLSLATCLAAVLVLLGLGHHFPWVVPVAWLAVVPPCFAAGMWISAPSRRERFTEGPRGPLRRALGAAVAGLVYIRELRGAPFRLRRRAIAGACLFWSGNLLCAWAALRSFGTRLDAVSLLLGYSTGFASTVLPLPIGGSGTVDAAMTGGFVLAGAPLGAALLGAVAFRLFNFWLPAVAALASVATVRGLRKRLREVAAARQARLSHMV